MIYIKIPICICAKISKHSKGQRVLYASEHRRLDINTTLHRNTGAITSVIVASIFMSTWSEGPAVSLNGSPTLQSKFKYITFQFWYMLFFFSINWFMVLRIHQKSRSRSFLSVETRIEICKQRIKAPLTQISQSWCWMRKLISRLLGSTHHSFA